MPGTPPTSPVLGLPRYSDSDVADFAACVNPIVDRLDVVTALRPGLTGWSASGTVLPNSSNVAFNQGITLTLPSGSISSQPRVRIFNGSLSYIYVAPQSGQQLYVCGWYGVNNTIAVPAGATADWMADGSGNWYLTSPVTDLLAGATLNFNQQATSAVGGIGYGYWGNGGNAGMGGDYPLGLYMPVSSAIFPLELGCSFYYTQGSANGPLAGSMRFYHDQAGAAVDGAQFDCSSTAAAYGDYRQKTVIQRCTSITAPGWHSFRIQMSSIVNAAYVQFYMGGWDTAHSFFWWVKQAPS